MNEKGQSLLELLFASLATIALAQILLLLIYFSSLRMYLDYRTHEALLCISQHSPSVCRLQFQKELQAFLIYGRIESLSLEKYSYKVSAKIIFRFPFISQNILWKFQDHLSLPLKS